jgi:4-hydroxybenzoyl-CoA thioesterase
MQSSDETGRQVAGSDKDQAREPVAFTPPPGAFTVTVPIRFSHSDPAGIVYFPHYFDMFNSLIEDWFAQELGIDFGALILEQGYGMPIVHADCDFRAPTRMGDRLHLTLLVECAGRSSLSYCIVGHSGGTERLRGRMVTAMILRESGRSLPIPDALRTRIEAYLRKTGPAA